MGVALTARAIAIDASPELRSAIAGMGRTEDVKFSPDNRRLAVAGSLFQFGARKPPAALPVREPLAVEHFAKGIDAFGTSSRVHFTSE